MKKIFRDFDRPWGVINNDILDIDPLSSFWSHDKIYTKIANCFYPQQLLVQFSIYEGTEHTSDGLQDITCLLSASYGYTLSLL